PFAGGLNSPQFSQIDLNLDGVLDLVIFERTTYKLKTFVNKGIENDPSYVYAPEFESQFPKISDIVVLKDYDFDGKVDFFTYKNPGINVWKNVSDSTLKFEEITYFEHTNVGYVNYITADYFGNYKANVYNLPGDIFSIEDIDDDGDLDLMNFGVWGSTMELHRNLSMEVTGKPDSMFFEYQSACWCKFIENSTSNDVTFPYNCKSNAPSNNNQSNNGSNRHAGSTILTLDLDGDGDKDYVLGDIG